MYYSYPLWLKNNPFTSEELVDVAKCKSINCNDCKAKEKCFEGKYTEKELEHFVMCPNNEILPKPDTNSYTYERFLPRSELFNGNKEKVKFVDTDFIGCKILRKILKSIF